jgi:hypothetical protein
MYSYSATPTNRLQINRADGAQFSFAVSSIVGNIDRSDFPARGESLSFVFRGQTANLTGSVARASASGDTTWRFQGVSWMNENETEQSTMDVSFTESSAGGGGSSSLTRRSSGSLSNSQRSLRWTVDVAAEGYGSGAIAAHSVTDTLVNTTIGSQTVDLDYRYEFTSMRDVAIAQHLWSGTVKQNSADMGSFVRTSLGGSSYSLDMTLGSTRHSTRLVQSTP